MPLGGFHERQNLGNSGLNVIILAKRQVIVNGHWLILLQSHFISNQEKDVKIIQLQNQFLMSQCKVDIGFHQIYF